MTVLPLIFTIILCQANSEINTEARAAMLLGARAAKVQSKLPVLNQVVLVPDEATYLDEISRWSPNARWPVLFDREPFASQFIRRFNPEKVLKRRSTEGKIDNLELAMQIAVANAWGGEASIEKALNTLKLPPLGIVFTSKNDTARTGAVALAAGRGQLLKYLQGDWGDSGDTLGSPKTTLLTEQIEETLTASGVNYKKIGDTIDAITICRTMPARVTFSAARENPVALSDVIGRDISGNRFAWTGWVFGSKAQSTYIAMCSLFLPRNQYWFCDTYPNSAPWTNYGFGNFTEILQQYGINAKTVEGTINQLQQVNTGGISTDLIMFTSKGNPDFLEMADGKTAPSWLPILNTPSILYFVHSWSLKNPQSKSTVGGTWLSRGVYAYVGSSHEPMLTAFVPPAEILKRTMSNIPFLPASRWFKGESMFANAWRVNTIGDPLMLCGPNRPRERMTNYSEAFSNYEEVSVLAKEAMQNAADRPSDKQFSAAINVLVLLGKDDLAIELWKASRIQSHGGEEAARAALPALFRQQNIDAFLIAFKLLRSPSRIERDLLWHLAGTSNTTPLQLLIDNLRTPYTLDDLEIIVDKISSSRGSAAVLSIIDEKLREARGRNKRGLERMRKEYGG
ncbi:MAG: hypothetical protein VX436_01715 [Planctomycetota bacterium]|nr:hypothetical protein [Planctomycetota bacterium]